MNVKTLALRAFNLNAFLSASVPRVSRLPYLAARTPRLKGKPREGTKTSLVIALLSREGGADFIELSEALGGTRYNAVTPKESIRSILSYDVNLLRGYAVETNKTKSRFFIPLFN